ncbi:hypothetical protein LX32DRAFT_638264 [Colletotrichum zoysiae]|uniref:Uncharacterized protein n=1 Tax=Colletotrichum zoysiae TaxID=1216348 RepID=A0AAD9HK26_9PEZI|nr:hypothetical protein LX32DRAFT_638264 [Colletotrichum zoysiae]
MAQRPINTQDDIDTVLQGVFEEFAPQTDSDSDPSWYSQCTDRVLTAWNGEKDANGTHETRTRIIKGIVVGINGTRYSESMSNVTANDIWGISLDICKEFCGRNDLDMATSFNRLASASTNYLLPWLALTAQLPYETGSGEADIIGVCIGLGSPLLMTFSLMMTILNKRWIRKRFRNLASNCEEASKEMKSRINSARVIAEETGQAPMRLLHRDGLLERLVTRDANTTWWSEAAKNLKSTRRPVTFSLIAQLTVAIIAWILTVTGSLKQKVGDTEEALVLSSGSLWIWLVPVIIGWVMVGTQREEDTVKRAFQAANKHTRVENGVELINDEDSPVLVPDAQRGDESQPHSPGTQPKQILGMFEVVGWQPQQGPVFNYARSITWLNFADHLHKEFKAATRRLDQQSNEGAGLPQQPRTNGTTENPQQSRVNDITGRPQESPANGSIDHPQHLSVTGGPPSHPRNEHTGDNGSVCHSQHSSATTRASSYELDELSRLDGIAGNSQHSTAMGGSPGHKLFEFTTLDEMSPQAKSTFKRHVAWSLLVALVLQWGTTGWAIYMAYETVVKGLGCRSGSYIIYGVLATVSCAAMLLSAWVSHFTMRGYRHATTATAYLQFCGAVAVMTRLFGQLLLIGNTIWLLAISIFELIGFFDSCYCAGTELSKGLEHGWILLFKSADALKADAQEAWQTGIGMGFVTTFLAVMIFYLASR